MDEMLHFVRPGLTARHGFEDPFLWNVRDAFVTSFDVGTWFAGTGPGWCAEGASVASLESEAVGRSQAVRQRVLVPRSQVRILAPQLSRRSL